MTSDAEAAGAVPVRLRPEILATPPYRQGKQAQGEAFKLSSNENPFDPLPGVIDAVTAATNQMNRYPDAAATKLRQTLAERIGVSIDQIHVGSGSVALLSQFILAAAGPGDEVVYSWRSFEAYPGLVTVAGATSVMVPNRADSGHDLDAMAGAVTERTRLVIVCSPNNPTGTVVSAQEFAAFMERIPADILVILDEAYAEFVTDGSAVNGLTLLHRYPNLVILRTFSKAYGLAGLRVGWAVGHPRILDGARATAIPLSVTGQAEIAAIASLAAETELLERVSVIAARRDDLWSSLADLGLAVPTSQANFVWFAAGDATDVVNELLLENGIVARAFSGSGIRVSIGEPESVPKILRAAQQIVDFLPEDHPMKRIT